MKSLNLIFYTIFFITISAQERLSYKIPENVTAVVEAKGNKFLENISLDEFNRTKAGKNILKKIFEEDKDSRDVKNLGIDFTSDFYYFNQVTDSTFYNCFLFSLSDSKNFEELLKLKDKNLDDLKYTGNIRELYDDENLMLWDSKNVLIVSGGLREKFLRDSVQAVRYGFKDVSIYDFYYPEDSVVMKKRTPYYYPEEEHAVEAEPTFTIPEPKENVDYSVNDEVDDSVSDAEGKEDEGTDASIMISDTKGYYEGYYDQEYREYYNTKAYDKAVAEQDSIKALLLRKWMTGYAYEIFNRGKNSPSVLENPIYKKSQDKDAAITFFVDIPKISYYDFLEYPGYYASYMMFLSQPRSYGGKSLNGKLYLNKKDIQLKTELEVEEEDISMYKAMYNHKLNKKFYKYIDQDKVIGFFSTAINTEKYLELYPKWMARMYGGIDSRYEEEAKLMAELFTLLLDEKAVAKVAKGDALFLFNGLSTKEYTYKTYEYDDDFNSTEVEKTKNETIPEFLFMASSDDTRFIQSLLRYGIKKEWVKFNNGIYTMDNSESKPYVFHLLIQDGIVFMGTSYDDISKIQKGTYVAKIGKGQKELLSKNNSTMYFEPKKLVNQVPKEEFEDIQKYMKIRNLLNGMGPMYAKYTGVIGNSVTGEAVMEATEEDKNSLKYFLRITELLSEF